VQLDGERRYPVTGLLAWRAHLGGAHNRHFALWDILMFQAWLERGQRAA